MNLPAGEVVTDAAPVELKAFSDLLQDLGKRSFNGYVAWLGRGYDGLEEGVVLFSEGKIVAASYEHLKYDHIIDGKDALEPAANVLAAKHVVYSVVSLTAPKINLVLAFNEKAKLPSPISPKNVLGLVPATYSDRWVKEIIKTLSQQDIDRIRLLAKYGLTGVKVGEI